VAVALCDKKPDSWLFGPLFFVTFFFGKKKVKTEVEEPVFRLYEIVPGKDGMAVERSGEVGVRVRGQA
jgi:hypothetical protein